MSTATELLRRALEAYDHKEEPYFERLHHAFEDIRAFIAAETEAKPSGYPKKVIEALYENGDPVSIDAAELLERLTENVEPKAEPVACVNTPLSMVYPEYNRRVLGARPEPARKPMTDEEMEKQYEIDKEYFGESVMRAFYNGVRFAEKHHGIGGDDEYRNRIAQTGA